MVVKHFLKSITTTFEKSLLETALFVSKDNDHHFTMYDFQNSNDLTNKNCLIIGEPNDLMRSLTLIFVNLNCNVTLGIDKSMQEYLFKANSITNELWSMGHKIEILEIEFENIMNFSIHDVEINKYIQNLDILIQN